MLYRPGCLIGVQYQLDCNQINKHAEQQPAGELPAYEEVFQDALDAVEQETMQRIIENEHSFSESECADSSQDLDGELDDEYNGPMDLPCERCSHFLFTEFDRARDHRAQLERMMAEPEKHGLSEDAKLHINDCRQMFSPFMNASEIQL